MNATQPLKSAHCCRSPIHISNKGVLRGKAKARPVDSPTEPFRHAAPRFRVPPSGQLPLAAERLGNPSPPPHRSAVLLLGPRKAYTQRCENSASSLPTSLSDPFGTLEFAPSAASSSALALGMYERSVAPLSFGLHGGLTSFFSSFSKSKARNSGCDQ